jgi:hypothetical protein
MAAAPSPHAPPQPQQEPTRGLQQLPTFGARWFSKSALALLAAIQAVSTNERT